MSHRHYCTSSEQTHCREVLGLLSLIPIKEDTLEPNGLLCLGREGSRAGWGWGEGRGYISFHMFLIVYSSLESTVVLYITSCHYLYTIHM